MPTAPSSQLALVVLARDEARCIARCLDSARAWVDRMVVLDTGSTDDTTAIAQACGAEVHHLPWPDDFARARNAALELADADWHLIMDADEWIVSGAEGLRDTLCTPMLGVVCVRNDFDLNGSTAQSHAWIPRLLPRGVRYAGRIHEQPVSPLPRTRLPLVLGHDGYTRARLASKQGRNRALLQQALQEAPDDAYLHYQLGKDCEIYGEHDAAYTHYRQACIRLPVGAGYRHDLVVRTLHCLTQAGQLDEALSNAEALMPDWVDSPDFFFTLGNLLLACALRHPEQAQAHWLPLAEAAWQRCLEIGERPELAGSVAGRGSHLAAHNLAVIRAGLVSWAPEAATF
ncbi:glycosyltransferase family 2 protein [Malikia sp.]|uniref:glycosyltransferase family 2 protein n=1 Tax=Malikia sp. TaxID=2070706 RepID=UPI00261C7F14|nr:glycosyltransferase family 2 protein [Malikia sp.]MDD2727892.1 glycosyltransferase family 2 protein [Malikia sp.]